MKKTLFTLIIIAAVLTACDSKIPEADFATRTPETAPVETSSIDKTDGTGQNTGASSDEEAQPQAEEQEISSPYEPFAYFAEGEVPKDSPLHNLPKGWKVRKADAVIADFSDGENYNNLIFSPMGSEDTPLVEATMAYARAKNDCDNNGFCDPVPSLKSLKLAGKTVHVVTSDPAYEMQRPYNVFYYDRKGKVDSIILIGDKDRHLDAIESIIEILQK